jgi:signal transduction histidine kinase
MVKLASQLGATGIEIDVQLTSDGVPVIYHDNQLNLRLIQKNGLVGPITNYTYDQLNTFVRLLDGEHIPTLREMLETALYQTPLQFIWMDTKRENSVEAEVALQKEYLLNVLESGRHLLTLINDVLDIAKIEAGKLTLETSQVDVRQLFDEVYTVTHVQAAQKGVELTFEVELEESAHARGDFGKVKQVLVNLVGNSLKFTQRGRISVRVRARQSAARSHDYAFTQTTTDLSPGDRVHVQDHWKRVRQVLDP